MASTNTAIQTEENFAELLEEYIFRTDYAEGQMATGVIAGIENDFLVVDVPGLKSEGRVPLRELEIAGKLPELNTGDEIEVYIDRFETSTGEAGLSYEKALREKAWERLEDAHAETKHVPGIIFGRVKGGFTVDLGGAVAFLPGSQVDIRPTRDIDPLMNIEQPFQILKMDRKRGNIVVSRRAILEESRAEERQKILVDMDEGKTLDGVVKNITDYGAFIDLGGVDGLLHVTDISWRRVNHPNEVLKLGDTVKVIVTKFNRETQRISLGMKQLEDNPWDNIEDRFPIGKEMRGTVTNITDYGAFVELEGGIEGLVHVSEMSWTKKNVHPGKIVSTSQEVDVKVLSIDSDKHRISLGMKQCVENPWSSFSGSQNVGDIIEGEVKNKTDFGLFIALNDNIDGLVHSSDISWDEEPEEALKAFKKGDIVKAKVLEINVDEERVALGIKQLADSPQDKAEKHGVKKGSVVTCTVKAVTKDGIDVIFGEDVQAFIKKNDLSRDRSEQRPERFAEGDRVDAVVTSVTRVGKITLSIKALEIEEEKKAIEEYGSTDSGATLGSILGAALDQAKQED